MSMLKLIRFSAALSIGTAILAIPQTAFSRPVSQTSGYQVAQNIRGDSPFCYMRTPQGALLDLENLCMGDDTSASNGAANVAAGSATPPPPPTPAPANATGTPGAVPPGTVTTIPSAAGGVATPNGNGAAVNPNNAANGTNPNINNTPTGVNPGVNNTNNAAGTTNTVNTR